MRQKERSEMKKTVVIGASHSGQMVASEIKRFDPDHEVVLIEKEKNVPFIASGINLVLKNRIHDLSDAIAPIVDLDKIGVKSFFGYEVVEINWDKKTIYYTNGKGLQEEDYTNLVLATGSKQYLPRQYMNVKNIYSYKSFSESLDVLKVLENANTIAISGTGYVGVELGEVLTQLNKQVSIIGPTKNLIQEYYDQEISDCIKHKFTNYDTSLFLENQIMDINEENNRLNLQLLEGSVACDVLIMANNSRPNSELYWNGLRISQDKTVEVNQYLQTNQPQVYAIGDLIALPNLLTKNKTRLSLITEARQTARIAALNIVGKKTVMPKQLNISTTQLFGLYFGSVGLTKEKLEQSNIAYKTIRVGNLSSFEKIRISLHVDFKDRIVGVQIVSEKNIQTLLDLLEIVIRSGWKMEELYRNNTSFFPMSPSFTSVLHEAAACYLAQI